MKFHLKKHFSDSIDTISIEICDPVLTPNGTGCPIIIDGEQLPVNIIGIDAINAIENSIIFIRSFLRNKNIDFFWENGEKYEDLA